MREAACEMMFGEPGALVAEPIGELDLVEHVMEGLDLDLLGPAPNFQFVKNPVSQAIH